MSNLTMKARHIILAISIVLFSISMIYIYCLASTSDYNNRFGRYEEDVKLWNEEMPKAVIMLATSVAVFAAAKFIPMAIDRYKRQKRAFEELKAHQMLRRQIARARERDELRDYYEFLEHYQDGYHIDDKDVKNMLK